MSPQIQKRKSSSRCEVQEQRNHRFQAILQKQEALSVQVRRMPTCHSDFAVGVIRRLLPRRLSFHGEARCHAGEKCRNCHLEHVKVYRPGKRRGEKQRRAVRFVAGGEGVAPP
eukprot:2867055-Amphidinium_carterae.1